MMGSDRNVCIEFTFIISLVLLSSLLSLKDFEMMGSDRNNKGKARGVPLCALSVHLVRTLALLVAPYAPSFQSHLPVVALPVHERALCAHV